MAEQKETVILEFNVDEDESIESINKLTKANKELRTERNALNLQSESGKKRAAEINTLLDKNTDKIKSNVSAIEKQKINIGNYKSALDGVHPVLGKVSEGLDSGSKGFLGMAKSALAFIATPIGAILAAIVVVFTLLKSALEQNDALMDKFENITNAVSVALEVASTRVAKLGEALIALATGDFIGAITKTKEAFTGLGKEIANAVKQQQLFLDASRNLEDAQISLSVKTAKYENEIKRLGVAARNRNLTFDEQEDLLRKSLALEEELIETKTDLARQDLIITARTLRKSKEFQQQDNENTDQYIQRLLTSEKLGLDERKKIADKVNALEEARGSSLPFQEKVANTLVAIDEKRTEAQKKLNEQLAIQAERQKTIDAVRERNANRKDRDPLADAFDKQLTLQNEKELKHHSALTKLMKEQLEQRAEEQKKYYDKKSKDAKKAADIEVEVERKKFQIIGNFIGGLADLAAEDSEARKVFATAQALINTYLGATAAFASGSEINVAFGFIAAAAAVAAGLANVAKINDVEFAQGGWTGPGHKMKPVGVVHADEYVAPKWVVHNQQAQPHLNALESIRMRGYADGGLVSSSLRGPIDAQFELMNIVKNMPAPEVSVREFNKVSKRVAVKEQISKR